MTLVKYKNECRSFYHVFNHTNILNIRGRRRAARNANYGLEPCADVIVSAGTRRSILVGGGAAGPKKLAAAAKKCFFSKIPEKISIYPQNFLMTFLIIENCNKISTQQQWHRRRADKLTAAARPAQGSFPD